MGEGDAPPPFAALRQQAERLGTRRALIVTSTLRGLHGSPLVAFDVGCVLAGAGVAVDFFTFDLGDPFTKMLAVRGFRCFDLAGNLEGLRGAAYDLVWAQHWPVYGFLFLELQVRVRYLALVSLSSYEPLESVQLLVPEAAVIVFNAPSTRDETLASLEIDAGKPVGVMHNALPPDWFAVAPEPVAPDFPRKVAIVSNRRAEEARQAGHLLAARGIAVEFTGAFDQPRLVDPEYIDRFDVIVAIGHTVQKALARARPVYCYDRFGGPGYINPQNLELAAVHNFSGRDLPQSRIPVQICEDICAGYAAAAAVAHELRRLAAGSYRLDTVLANLLARLEPRPDAVHILRGKRSADRKLVRYAANFTAKYDLFSPESAMAREDGQNFLRVAREVHSSGAIMFFQELNPSGPKLYAVSRQPRMMQIQAHVLPMPGVEIEAITVCHDDGTSTKVVAGQASPWLKGKFPDHPRSNAGRLTAYVMLHSDIRLVELVATLADRRQEVLFSMVFEPM